MHPFKNLIAWKLAHALVLELYRATAAFPETERFGLTNQMRRAAISVAANIAEGSIKNSKAEFRRYLDIALASMTELECLLLIARDLDMLAGERWLQIEERRAEAGRVLWGVYRSMGKPRTTRTAA